MRQDGRQKATFVKIDVVKINLSNGPNICLFITDLTSALEEQLRNLKRSTLQSDHAVSFCNKMLSPLNFIMATSDKLQSKLRQAFDSKGSQLGSQSSRSESPSSSKDIGQYQHSAKEQVQGNDLSSELAMDLYDDARLVWGSAHIMRLILDSQLTISKIVNK